MSFPPPHISPHTTLRTTSSISVKNPLTYSAQSSAPGQSAHAHPPSQPASYTSNLPVQADFPELHFVIGGGVAIFHVASARVVVCKHGRDGYWFLPKGRRDVGETTEQAAEREGFEESGYRNRLLPLPLPHRQPQPRIPTDPRFSSFSTEPIFCQLYPASSTCQYVAFWYISETVPPDVEEALNRADQEAEESGSGIFGAPYQYPPRFEEGLTLKERVAREKRWVAERGGGGGVGGVTGEGGEKKVGYEPIRHENTGMDPEEALYESYLLSVPEALEKLQPIPVMQYVVRIGWEAITKRLSME